MFKFIILICLIISCKASISDKEIAFVDINKLRTCHKNYIKKDLQQINEVTVLFFSKQALIHTGVTFPNYLIGVTKENDTIGCLDNVFESDIKLGQTISISPYEWSIEDKDYLKIPINVNPQYFKLFCQVKTVYYCKFELIKK